jgi:threonine aldolase
MRKAMFEAELGDDVFEEDPTINKLQQLAAERLGKEAGLFVASGAMGNLVALLTHCGRGAQVIAGANSHIYHYEQGGAAALGGIHTRVIANQPDGKLDLKEIARSIDPEDVHYPRTRLICLENTWNGIPLSPQYCAEVAGLAKRNKLSMHLDGARLFNAAIALRCGVNELARDFHSITFCLSKGLSAPVGSVLCGSADFIKEARRNRKLVGGGMRQAGVLAAAGIVALNQMVDRLSEDHANARLLAEGLAAIPAIEIDLNSVHTNMVFFGLKNKRASLDDLVETLEGEGIQVLTAGSDKIRAVTHYGITRADIDSALTVIQRVLGGAPMVSHSSAGRLS